MMKKLWFKSVGKSLVNAGPLLWAGLDVGTSKVACCIARWDATRGLRVVGLGQNAARGLRAGSIVDMGALEEAIRGAVSRAEDMARETISGVYVSVSAALTQSQTRAVDAVITGHPVDETDLRKMLIQACQGTSRPSHDVLHVLPTRYQIDGNSGIKDPRGMFGDTLQGRIHVVSAQHSPLRNMTACIERCHLEVKGFALGSYAAGLATLVEDEKELGVTLVDMGAGSTTAVTFLEGTFCQVVSVPMGGAHVTSDIAKGLSTPLVQAERIKTLFGSAMSSSGHDLITVPQIGEEEGAKGLQVTRAEITRIIRPRMEETFELLRDGLRAAGGGAHAGHRLVLTGGASGLAGVRELCELILARPTRLGRPMTLVGHEERVRQSAFSTCAGLILHAHAAEGHAAAIPTPANTQKNVTGFDKVRTWFRENV
ncbi:MAG: cell division protein FtsA [Proteobacteria bacterium]|nr:cell division protein FtsA [Pseudomonadota bacterium]